MGVCKKGRSLDGGSLGTPVVFRLMSRTEMVKSKWIRYCDIDTLVPKLPDKKSVSNVHSLCHNSQRGRG